LSRLIAPLEKFMTIMISNLTVAPSAPTGTIVGVLTATDAGSVIPCDFILSKKSSGYFAVSSNNLITVWSGSIAPGYYPFRVRAVGTNEQFSSSAISPSGWSNFPSVRTPLHQRTDGVVNNPVNIPGIGFVDESDFAGPLMELPPWFVANAT
jgi:hypothetical protein